MVTSHNVQWKEKRSYEAGKNLPKLKCVQVEDAVKQGNEHDQILQGRLQRPGRVQYGGGRRTEEGGGRDAGPGQEHPPAKPSRSQPRQTGVKGYDKGGKVA